MGCSFFGHERHRVLGELTMTIDARCKEQRLVADQLFMDFKCTAPGSKEQLRALNMLSFLIGMWGDFLKSEERRLKLASTLKITSAI